MDKKTAQTTVKVISVLYWIGAFFGLIAALVMFVGGSMMSYFPTVPNLTSGLVAVMGVVILVFAVLAAFVGYGLWNHKSWAKIVAIVLGVIGLFNFPFGTIINAFIIYFLAFNKDVKGLFH